LRQSYAVFCPFWQVFQWIHLDDFGIDLIHLLVGRAVVLLSVVDYSEMLLELPA